MGLEGKTILSFCSAEKGKKIKDVFERKNAVAYNFPVTNIQRADENKETVKKKLSELASYDLIAFTSSKGVKFFFDWIGILAIEADITKLNFAAIGKATAKALSSFGYHAKYISKAKDSVEFSQDIKNNYKERIKILVPTGNLSAKNLERILSPDHICHYLTIYNTIQKTGSDVRLRDMLNQDNYDFLIFMSPSSVDGLLNNLPDHIEIKNKQCIAIGNTTKDSLIHAGIDPFFIPSEPNIEILSDELENFINKNNIS